MKYSWLIVPLAIACCAMRPLRAETSEEAKKSIDRAIGALLQADGPEVQRSLLSLPLKSLDERDRHFRRCVLGRLSGVSSPLSPDVAPEARQALRIYERYWREALKAPSRRDAAEATLLRDLRKFLKRRDLKESGEIEDALSVLLKSKGYWSLTGRTGYLDDLMIWSRQTESDHRIALPDGEWTTKVFALDGFITQGWSNFLSCDRTGTGGWTKPEGLYAIVPAYKSLDDENFTVNFLTHESQHYADGINFPALSGWELEYRAKLAELSAADQTMKKVLGGFADNQGDDPKDQHSFADRKVLEDMRRRLGLPPGADLGQIDSASVRAAAVETLKADSARRR